MVSEEEYVSYVRQFSDTVLRIAVNYCKELPDAEDMVQEVFLKLYETGMDFTDDEHVKRWLIRVTVNLCKNHLASAWHRRTQLVEFQKIESALEQPVDLYAADVSGTDEGSALFEAVASLPEKYRSVVHLYYYEDYSVKEIAQILQKKETTIQTRLMRARKKLEQQLKGAWQDE
ncbi:MAG: sigma-70 family RNA polymerase sigma factor [Lachnospiraceae bacterium]|nr:sigma-70 family RNA polymerase sigma factor [Lachnospiraceae bacterium]MCI8781285.1 sigma-70 family RNA polymerase sigma factor [Lachnospiraceae bacterium]